MRDIDALQKTGILHREGDCKDGEWHIGYLKNSLYSTKVLFPKNTYSGTIDPEFTTDESLWLNDAKVVEYRFREA